MLKRVTKIQIATIVLLLAYAIYEFLFLAKWKSDLEGPPIRVDLLPIYIILIVFISISVFQSFRIKNWIIGGLIILMAALIFYFTTNPI